MLPQTRQTPCCILDRWSDKEQIREILLFMYAQYSYPRLAPISVCCETLSIHFIPIHQGYKALWQPKCRRKNFIENGYMNNMDPLTTTIRPLESKAQHSNVHIHGYTAQGCNRPQFSMAYDDHRNGYQQSMKSLEITIHLVHVIGKPDGGWIYTQRVIYNKKQEYCTRYPPCCAALKLHNRWSVLLMSFWATSLQEHKKRVNILREVLEITMFREVNIFRRGLKCQYPPIGVIGTILCNNSPFHIVLTFSIAVTMVLLSKFFFIAIAMVSFPNPGKVYASSCQHYLHDSAIALLHIDSLLKLCKLMLHTMPPYSPVFAWTNQRWFYLYQ